MINYSVKFGTPELCVHTNSPLESYDKTSPWEAKFEIKADGFKIGVLLVRAFQSAFDSSKNDLFPQPAKLPKNEYPVS